MDIASPDIRQQPRSITELLPIEIWQRVLFFVEHTEVQQFLPGNTYTKVSYILDERVIDDFPNLPYPLAKRFCLLSKATLDFATASLYRRVQFNASDQSGTRLASFLTAVSSDRGKLVQQLTIWNAELGQMDTISNIIAACPKLTKFRLKVCNCPGQSWQLPASLDFRHVRTLSVHWDSDPVTGANFVAAFTNLASLNMQGDFRPIAGASKFVAKITKLSLLGLRMPTFRIMDVRLWTAPLVLRSLVVKDCLLTAPDLIAAHDQTLEVIVYDNFRQVAPLGSVLSPIVKCSQLKHLTLRDFRRVQHDDTAMCPLHLPQLETLTFERVDVFLDQLTQFVAGPRLKSIRCLYHALDWPNDPRLALCANISDRWDYWHVAVDRLVEEIAEQGIAMEIQVDHNNFPPPRRMDF